MSDSFVLIPKTITGSGDLNGNVGMALLLLGKTGRLARENQVLTGHSLLARVSLCLIHAKRACLNVLPDRAGHPREWALSKSPVGKQGRTLTSDYKDRAPTQHDCHISPKVLPSLLCTSLYFLR